MRASRQQVSSTLGKNIFHSDDKHRVAQKIKKVGREKLSEALSKRGVKNMDADKLAENLSGSKRATLSQQEMRHVVQALQDVGLAQTAESADKMVLNAARQAQDGLKQHIHEMTLERRAEANLEEAQKTSTNEPESILDRMRTAQAKANRKDRGAGTAVPIRELRDWRSQMSLQPKLQMPKSKPPEEPPIVPFQA